MYLSLGISISLSTGSELFSREVFQAFVILLPIILSIKSPVSSAVFEAILSASVADCLA